MRYSNIYAILEEDLRRFQLKIKESNMDYLLYCTLIQETYRDMELIAYAQRNN
jgi:cytidylate kinase